MMVFCFLDPDFKNLELGHDDFLDILFPFQMKVLRISDLLFLRKIGHLERRGNMKLLTKEICLPAPSKGCQLNPKGW